MVRYRRGVFWQNLFLSPDGSISSGPILKKSLSKPRGPRRSRGVFWQNLFLRPDGLISTGLIPAKFLSTPRWPDITGAYSGKISFYALFSWYHRGLFRQNFFLRPDGPISSGLILAKSLSKPRCPVVAGAYFDKISFYAPMVRYRRGVFRQNFFLRPDGSISPGRILTKALSKSQVQICV